MVYALLNIRQDLNMELAKFERAFLQPWELKIISQVDNPRDNTIELSINAGSWPLADLVHTFLTNRFKEDLADYRVEL